MTRVVHCKPCLLLSESLALGTSDLIIYLLVVWVSLEDRSQEDRARQAISKFLSFGYCVFVYDMSPCLWRCFPVSELYTQLTFGVKTYYSELLTELWCRGAISSQS